MTGRERRRSRAPGLAAALLVAQAAPLLLGSQENWLQHGGSRRDFRVEATGLAATWPSNGPPVLWKRELGDGFSPIAVHGDSLYTLVFSDGLELVFALDTETGHTLWQHGYRIGVTGQVSVEPGSRATPLVIGNALYTVGLTGQLHRFHRQKGSVEWSRDLASEFGAPMTKGAFAASPLAYRNTLIVPVGAPAAAVVSLDQKSGRVVWQAHDYRISSAPPILIDVGGQPQLVLVTESEVVALHPGTGAVLWRHPVANRSDAGVAAPVYGPGNLLLVPSTREGGTRALRLSQTGGATGVTELWFSGALRMHSANPIRIGDTVFGVGGDSLATVFTALDIASGRVRWQQSGVAAASMIHADGKFIILSEDGELLLATVAADRLTVHAKAPVLSAPSLTPPSLAGTRLYARDRRHVLALELK